MALEWCEVKDLIQRILSPQIFFVSLTKYYAFENWEYIYIYRQQLLTGTYTLCIHIYISNKCWLV